MGRKWLSSICLLLLTLVLVWADSEPLTFSTISDPQTLRTIRELQNIEFGHRFPRHGLHLLYFIANRIDVNDNNDIVPMFVPARGDWGFHKFNNYEGVFPPLIDQNVQGYYSVGNLNTQYSLPPYVTQNYCFVLNDPDANRDRVVVRTKTNSNVLDAVYVTQHIYNSSRYDGKNTRRISPALLKEIQSLSKNWIDSLNLFLSSAHYDTNGWNVDQFCNFHCTDNNIGDVEEASGGKHDEEGNFIAANKDVTASTNDNRLKCFEIELEVKAIDKGYARIRWSDVPDNLLEKGCEIRLCTVDNNCKSEKIGKKSYGTIDTNEYLNNGLYVSLKVINGIEVIRGPIFDETDRKLPVDIKGYDASLQLYTENGWACARLFIKDNVDWKKKFYNSWVGFYSNPKNNNYYNTYQWATYFKYVKSIKGGYDIYKYCSSVYIQPEAQARFFLNKEYVSSAETPCWEC